MLCSYLTWYKPSGSKVNVDFIGLPSSSWTVAEISSTSSGTSIGTSTYEDKTKTVRKNFITGEGQTNENNYNMDLFLR